MNPSDTSSGHAVPVYRCLLFRGHITMTPLPPLERCHTKEQIAGKEQATLPWDVASITMMAEVHLLHEQPNCPFDDTPITFTSMPNPRRKARYRLSCFYCGRHAELNWPPPEAKR